MKLTLSPKYRLKCFRSNYEIRNVLRFTTINITNHINMRAKNKSAIMWWEISKSKKKF
jgi:hypothetical protein